MNAVDRRRLKLGVIVPVQDNINTIAFAQEGVKICNQGLQQVKAALAEIEKLNLSCILDGDAAEALKFAQLNLEDVRDSFQHHRQQHLKAIEKMRKERHHGK